LSNRYRADELVVFASARLEKRDLRAVAPRTREMHHLVELCHETPVAPGNPRVRLPGEGALSRRRRQIRDGIQLHETIIPALTPWAERFGIALPQRSS
jgi:LDH2 family malate/lactate/ureidoglycolate dehydrogenase